MKTAFLFDSVTGIHTGTFEAPESQVAPGNYIKPTYSTYKPLPVVGVNEVAVMAMPDGSVPTDGISGDWVVKQDHRGATWYDATGNPVAIDTIGIPAAGLTPDMPLSIILAKLQQAKIIELNIACGNFMLNGFTSSALGNVHIYDSKLEDQLNLTGVMALNADSYYKCLDGAGVKAFLPHSAAQIKQVGIDGAMFKMVALSKVDGLKKAVMLATTLADINAIVW